MPIGIAAVLASVRWLPASRRQKEQFDLFGAALLGLGLSGLTLSLSFGAEWGWTSPTLLGSAALSAIALGAVVPVEARAAHPNLDLELLRKRAFATALGSLVLSFVALFAVSFLMPFYLENLRGLSTATSGLLLTPLPLAIGVSAPISGWLADRIGSRWLASSGLALSCAGLLLLSAVGADSPLTDVVWRQALIGLGIGMFQSPNNRALMQTAPADEQGEASGVLGTGRVIGQSLSVALAGAVFAVFGGLAANAALAAHAGGQTLPPDQLTILQHTFVTGFRAALTVCAGVAAIGIVTSLVRSE